LEAAMLGSGKKSAAHIHALERVKAWTRVRFSLSEDAVILVSEIACSLPGCPPLETVIAFWTGDGRHHFKLFKPVEEVIDEDLPPYWMKDALVVPEGAGCDCC
jgi:hypothetical protein